MLKIRPGPVTPCVVVGLERFILKWITEYCLVIHQQHLNLHIPRPQQQSSTHITAQHMHYSIARSKVIFHKSFDTFVSYCLCFFSPFPLPTFWGYLFIFIYRSSTPTLSAFSRVGQLRQTSASGSEDLERLEEAACLELF